MVIRISDPVPNFQLLQTATYPYFDKNLFQFIIMIEDQYLEKEPRMVAEKIFPLNWHFPPSDIRKTQKFYENILIEIKSIAVKHYKFYNINAFTHLTVQFLSVLTLAAWENSSYDFKRFSQNYDPQYFNY